MSGNKTAVFLAWGTRVLLAYLLAEQAAPVTVVPIVAIVADAEATCTQDIRSWSTPFCAASVSVVLTNSTANA